MTTLQANRINSHQQEVNRIAEATLQDGGCTYWFKSGHTFGYVVGNNTLARQSTTEMGLKSDISGLLFTHRGHDGLGTWLSPDGVYFTEPVTHYQDILEALLRAQETDEHSIFELSSGRCIELAGHPLLSTTAE